MKSGSSRLQDDEFTEARICPFCKAAQPVAMGEALWPVEWTCRACGESVLVKGGVPHYAPDLAEASIGFNPTSFETLAQCERGHFWFEPRNRLLVGLSQSYFPSARRYLEIGCGTGFVLSAFAASRPWSRLIGSEIHPQGLLTARERLGPQAELIQMDARAIPARHAFDLVGAYDVLEHIVEDETVIREVHTTLVPGGGFIAAVPQHPFLWSETDEISYHVRRYRRGELENKLRSAGFEILFSTSYTVALLPLMIASRRRPKMEGRFGAAHDQGLATREVSPRPRINAALRVVTSAEVALTLKGVRWPVGGSRIVVARRPPSSATV